MTRQDGPRALSGVLDVSRETIDQLSVFANLLKRWQKVENLVSPDTLPVLWRRHIADSAQLIRFAPEAKRWLDIGSGGGFPGIVLAILMDGVAGATVSLVESNHRKGAFLRRVVQEMDLSAARVLTGRIETVLLNWEEPVDRLTARALAPLPRLLDLAYPILATGTVGLFHKGRDYQREISEASLSWHFNLIKHQSLIDESSTILEISGVALKTPEVRSRS